MMDKIKNEQVLIFGATGFVGSHLLKRLIKRRVHVTVIARTPKKLRMKSKYLTIVQGDLLEPETYKKQLKTFKTIYYLVHAMGEDGNFEKIESKQANALAALLTKKQRVIYLSGLGSPDSEHIRSRQKVGKIFHDSAAQSIELRASIVLGAGSLSFEMIHGIARRFPFSVKTHWSESECEPVALDDILYALDSLRDRKHKAGIYEIGCGETIPYSDLIIRTANLKGKKMIKIPLPAVSKTLVLEVMRFMLPEYYQTGQHLMGSIEIPTYVKNENVLSRLGKKPVSINEAIKKAIFESEEMIKDDFTWQDKIADIVSTLPERHKAKIRLMLNGLRYLRKL